MEAGVSVYQIRYCCSEIFLYGARFKQSKAIVFHKKKHFLLVYGIIRCFVSNVISDVLIRGRAFVCGSRYIDEKVSIYSLYGHLRKT